MVESAVLVAEYAAAVEKAWATHGMVLHWRKTQALPICIDDRVLRPDGTVIDANASLEYSRALLCADIRADSEVSRKIGLCLCRFPLV